MKDVAYRINLIILVAMFLRALTVNWGSENGLVNIMEACVMFSLIFAPGYLFIVALGRWAFTGKFQFLTLRF